MSKTKQPWNAFPLASLSVRGISACAADILRYLAIRSDWRGSVIVGQRRMAEDLKRSKGYVTKGLNELGEKKLLSTEGRCRAIKQAEKHTISSSILSAEYQALLAKRNHTEKEDDNPTYKDDEPLHDPIERDVNNPTCEVHDPTYKDETLQLEPYSVTSNLADSDQRQLVSKLVDSECSLRSHSTGELCSLSPEPRTEQHIEPSEQEHSHNQHQEAVTDLPCFTPVCLMFQTYNYDSANDQDMRNIQAVINALSWDLGDLSSCFRWSQKHTWWKSRIVSIKSFANAMVNGVNGIATEKSLPSQYLRRVGGKKAIGAGE